MLKDKSFLTKRIEFLDQYNRSNQDTCLVHKPAVNIGEWVEAGDLLADSSASMNGELAIGKNIIVAYMPWEGFNYEDAILINERLVYDDVYTSIHIERYEIETKDGLNGSEHITREIPDIDPEAISHLDSMGIAKVGSWIEEGTILVGKVTPVNKKAQTPYQRLLFKLLEKNLSNVRDSSLRAPKGIKANVIYVNILTASSDTEARVLNSKYKKMEKTSKKNLENNEQTVQRDLVFLPTGQNPQNCATPSDVQAWKSQNTSNSIYPKNVMNSVYSPQNEWLTKKNIKRKINTAQSQSVDNFKLESYLEACKSQNLNQKNTLEFSQLKKWLNKKGVKKNNGATVKNSIHVWDLEACKSLSNKNKSYLCLSKKLTLLKSLTQSKKSQTLLNKSSITKLENPWNVETCKTVTPFQKTDSTQNVFYSDQNPLEQNLNSLKGLDKVKQIPTNVHIYLAEKRKIQVGDKMAGRHGNKGIISNILPREDMPYLPDGTAIDIVLNPLGVPSRMNVGQIYECLLGLAGKYLGEHYKINPFDEMYGAEASRSFVFSKLFEARKKTGIEWLFDPNSPGKMRIFDGRTSESFDQPVTVGIAYMLKLVHMVDDKVHARSTGPYSLVTQQPLRGRAKQGGQRLGEMEVWAIEGYGAAFVLLEMLTLKSDDMTGRLTLWSNLILNKEITIGTPESFKVLVCELQALCLDIGLFHYSSNNQTSHINSNSNTSLLASDLELNKNLTDVKSNKTKQQLFLKEISHLMLLP
jgi:DNA-directed RNA polymerase subunit beta